MNTSVNNDYFILEYLSFSALTRTVVSTPDIDMEIQQKINNLACWMIICFCDVTIVCKISKNT